MTGVLRLTKRHFAMISTAWRNTKAVNLKNEILTRHAKWFNLETSKQVVTIPLWLAMISLSCESGELNAAATLQGVVYVRNSI